MPDKGMININYDALPAKNNLLFSTRRGANRRRASLIHEVAQQL
jgi:hypothetical protein